MNIEVHIGRIVLEGVDATSDQSRIVRSAVREELARLLAVHGVGPALIRGGAIPDITGATFDRVAAGTPRDLGSSVGRAVHMSLSGARRATGSDGP